MTKRNRRKVYGILLTGILLLNAFLTFQSAEGTVNLSEGLRLWLEQFGFKSDFHSFRSDAHLVMFFLIGSFLGLFCREIDWPWKLIVMIGFLVGCIDEGIKVILPTREFDLLDLFKDWLGLGIAFLALIIKEQICLLHFD